jgi:uncharacterized protein YciI
MADFFLKLIAPRPSFAMDMNDDEKKMMHEHFQYWKSRQDAGTIIVFGPVLDPEGPYGIGVISANDEAGARHFADNDPAVTSGLGFTCEIHPMRAVTRGNTHS